MRNGTCHTELHGISIQIFLRIPFNGVLHYLQFLRERVDSIIELITEVKTTFRRRTE